MMIENYIENFKKKGYEVHHFSTREEAASYLEKNITEKTVGFGDSVTLFEMDLYHRLSLHNQVFDPMHAGDQTFNEVAKTCLTTQVFLTSVNAATVNGELINIDSTGNRVAGSLFGHETVYFVFSTNKIAPSIEDAIWRVRNIAAPMNAKRHGYRTPCALLGDKCYDCKSPDRICNMISIHLQKLKHSNANIIIFDEPLGY